LARSSSRSGDRELLVERARAFAVERRIVERVADRARVIVLLI
jgi:hypothetical protein